MRPPLLPRELLREPLLRELLLLDPELREPELREPPPPLPPRRWASWSSVVEADGASTPVTMTASPAVGCRLSIRLMKPAIDVLVLLFIA